MRTPVTSPRCSTRAYRRPGRRSSWVTASVEASSWPRHGGPTWATALPVSSSPGPVARGSPLRAFPARGLPPALASLLRRAWFGALRATTLVGRRVWSVRWLSTRLVRRIGVGPKASQDVVDRVRKSFLSTRAPALAATTLASLSHNGTDLASSLQAPALVLHGGADPEVSEDTLEELLIAVPGSERVEYPAAGHMLPLTHPADVADQVARWTRRVLGP